MRWQEIAELQESAIVDEEVSDSVSKNPSAKPIPKIKQNPVELLSAKGIDYRELEKLLKDKEWRKADELTAKHILKVANREKEGWLDTEHIQAFPCEDLWTIDQLWVHYSNSKFGFSIQKKLWLECGGEIGKHDVKVWIKFASTVGWYYLENDDWRQYKDFMNDTNNAQNAPPCSLPVWWGFVRWGVGGWGERVVIGSLFLRMELVSARGSDYRELEKLLINKDWRKADELTAQLMLKAANRKERGWINEDDMRKFPCEDLKIIDQLWVHYSASRFGFSIQRKLWLECGGKVGIWDSEVFRRFGEKVGWYHPNKGWLTYTDFMNDTKDAQNAFLASLPRIDNEGCGLYRNVLGVLISRVETCEV